MKKYRTVQVILPLLIFFVFFMHLSVYAYSPYVFKIISKNCSSCPNKGEKAQTGFTVQGKSGIITALHGVVGRLSVNAINLQGNNKYFNKLKIAEVDIEHDLALLSSTELHGKMDGFNIPGKQPDYTKIQSIGYPLNVPEQIPVPIVQLNAHLPYRKLWTLLPP
ncbi:MAG: hypothetical protein D3923_17795, partial [Candidatus Electrothrix sp. AR3]|nr:hypothetical protein [Candidatus Electrothrix sp. AR3]